MPLPSDDGKNREGSELLTKLFSSVVQWPCNVGKAHGSANCHRVFIWVNGDCIEMAKVDLDPVADCTQTC